jgi:NAD(P)H dehydrogenase (quinone)
MSEQTLLITGGSGHLGRRVLELLLAAKVGKLVTTTRTPEKLADLAARGVDVRQADFDNPATLPAAFAGVDRLLLISTDSFNYPGQRVDQHNASIAAAVAAGVKHLLYTSFVRTQPGNPAAVAPDHYATEQALIASPLDYTLLRNNLYSDNLLMSLPQAIAMGQLFSAGNGGKTAYVTREDCARAAAAALAATTTGRQTLNITGPQALSDAEIAQLASEISGRPVQFVPLSVADKRAGMIGAGLPPAVADLLLSFEVATAQGFVADVSTAVTDLTGVAPQSVRDFLLAQRAALSGAA